MGKSKDWAVWCRSRKKDEEQRPGEVDGKEIFSNRSKQANPKAGEKTDKTGGKGQSVRWKVWWRQGKIKCAVSEEYASCWVHQHCHLALYFHCIETLTARSRKDETRNGHRKFKTKSSMVKINASF